MNTERIVEIANEVRKPQRKDLGSCKEYTGMKPADIERLLDKKMIKFDTEGIGWFVNGVYLFGSQDLRDIADELDRRNKDNDDE